MTAYTSAQLTGPRFAPVSGPGMGGRTSHRERGSFALTAALAVNDTIALFNIPKNARITGGFIKSDKLDTNGTPAITLDVGIAGSQQLFWAASTVSQAGGVDTNMAAMGRDYLTTAKAQVIATVRAGPATGATSGNIVVHIEYLVEEPA